MVDFLPTLCGCYYINTNGNRSRKISPRGDHFDDLLIRFDLNISDQQIMEKIKIIITLKLEIQIGIYQAKLISDTMTTYITAGNIDASHSEKLLKSSLSRA